MDIAVIYCITSLREQTFLSNYCIISRTPTLPSPSPIHSRNIAIEAAATNAEFTVVHYCFITTLHCHVAVFSTTDPAPGQLSLAGQRPSSGYPRGETSVERLTGTSTGTHLEKTSL